MNQYVIQRDLPGAGSLSAEQLADISTRSVAVLADMRGIEWVHSYVTSDRIYCVYLAENESLVLEHARRGGFPCTQIALVSTVISPATARQVA
jgi:hypothetical protein